MAPERTSATGIGFPEIILFKNLALQFYSTKLNRPCFNVSERPSIPQPFYGTRDREGGVIGIIYLFMTRVWLLSLQNLSLEFHSLKLIVCPCFDVSEWSFMPQPFYGTRNRDWRVPLASFMTRVWLLTEFLVGVSELKADSVTLFRCFRVVVYASAILWH